MPTDRSPLLAKTRVQPHAQRTSNLDEDHETGLPASKMARLCFVRFAEPLSFSILLPFVNQMVQSTGTREELVGYRAGCVEGVFSLVSALVMIPWALASDHFGRKPCLIVSLCGTAVATAVFGFSRTLRDMLLWRAVAGAFSGSSVVLRTLFSEVTAEAHQARALSYYAFAGNIALLIGPILGGSFSQPAQQFPALFRGVRPLVEYPYALPGLIVGGLLVTVSASCWAILDEPQRTVAPQKAHSWAHYLTTEVTVVLSVFSIAMLLGNCYTALVPLWAYTSVDLGGLGWTPLDIAGGLACTGLLQALWLLTALSLLDKKLGSRRLTQMCFLAWPACLLSPVLINQLMRQHCWVWAYFAMAVSQTSGTGVAMAFTTCQLLLNKAAPPEALGTLNGIALALNAVFRSAGPVAISSAFAFGVENHVLSDHLAWFALACVAMVGFFVSQRLSEKPRQDVCQHNREVAEV